ncbi:MAG TPA: alpha/beta fold hydrolase [Bacteroidales bacterium]|nr:alpha/beta fold hydrolase [Bacteroidales bacterium]HSA44089.1 alpha/beta fold hydrolase [Bacteroidales bacterium]
MKKSLKKHKIITLFAVMMTLMNLPGAWAQVPGDVLSGSWAGSLSFGKSRLKVVFRFMQDDKQGWLVLMDSPDQGAEGIEVEGIRLEGDSVILESRAVNGIFRGVYQASDTSIAGSWSQSGLSLPLRLDKTTEDLRLRRPQEPKPPFPYQTEEVTFRNQFGGIRLSGTLSIPEGTGSFPACILISGSGPQDRDESLLWHKPFLVIADQLSRNGIAVLRYDDRGTGSSEGKFETATTLDFATDARAAFDYLRNDNRIIPSGIGFAGHSEGGLIAAIVAGQNLATAFVILLAGPALPGDDLLLRQNRLIAEAMGSDSKQLKEADKTNREIFSIVKKTADTAAAAMKIRKILQENLTSSDNTEAGNAAYIEAQIRQLNSPWFRTFLTLDPVPYLSLIQCPVLALYGSKDLQVPPDDNIKALKKALEKANNADHEVVELQGLNHLFQPAQTGSPEEYGKIEVTISPRVLEIITAWLKQKTS